MRRVIASVRRPIQQRPYVNPADEDEYKMRLGELLVRAQGPSGDPRLPIDPRLAATRAVWAEPAEDPRLAEMRAMIEPRQPDLNYPGAPEPAEDGEGQLRKALGAALIGLAVAPLEGVMKRGEQREHQDFQLRLARETAGAEREFRAGESKAERDARAELQKERLDAEAANREQADKWRREEWEHERSPAALTRKFAVAQAEQAGGTPAELAAIARGEAQAEGTPGVQQQLAAEAAKHYGARANQLLTRYESEGRSGRKGSSIGWTEAQPEWLADRAVELANEIKQRYPAAVAGPVLADALAGVVQKLYEARPRVRWSTPRQWEPLVEHGRGRVADAILKVKGAMYGVGNEGVFREQVAREDLR